MERSFAYERRQLHINRLLTSFFIGDQVMSLVFIRDKKVKGHSYAYLVRNVWDNKNGRVRQEIVKYLVIFESST